MNARLVSLSLLALVVAVGTGCAGGDGKISIDTSTTKLSDAPNDALFIVKVDDARADGYDLAGLTVKVQVKDASSVDIACAPVDTNANKKLDKGETLSCTEGPTNIFDMKTVGKEATVELHAKVDGDDLLVGDADWKP